MKKQYTKPTMKVYPLLQQPQILAGSTPTSDDWLNYTPTITHNDKNLT